MQIIAHGGAGSSPDDPAERQSVLDEAAMAGAEAATPTDAVAAATRLLESDPRFNAGVGGAVQADGHVRTDAGLMTDDLAVGAACGMPGVEHAIDVARVVKEETPHVLLAGVHAVDLAAAFGIETEVDLWSDRSRERWNALPDRPSAEDDVRSQAAWVADHFGGDPAGDGSRGHGSGGNDTRGHGSGGDDGSVSQPVDRDHDTVGAVATDGDRVAAATSTCGRWLAMAGRVGDVPQVGAGFYCTPAAGASATGAGEDIARVTLSRRAVQLAEDGLDAGAAADAAIAEFGDRVEGTAGVILLTPEGDAGVAYDSEAMQTASAGGLDG